MFPVDNPRVIVRFISKKVNAKTVKTITQSGLLPVHDLLCAQSTIEMCNSLCIT